MERRKFTREFKLEAVRLIKDRGVSYVQASQDLGVHPSQLRDWVKKFADDPQHAFPGHGQMNPAMVASMRVPAIYPFREYGQSGGLVSYGANLPDMYRRAANYVDSLHPSSPPRATLL